jgi:hypothetical protein
MPHLRDRVARPHNDAERVVAGDFCDKGGIAEPRARAEVLHCIWRSYPKQAVFKTELGMDVESGQFIGQAA